MTVSTTDSSAISLASLGEDFARALPENERSLAGRAPLPVLSVPRGPWTPPGVDEQPRGVIVVRGVLLRGVELAGRRFAQVVDDGEVLDPWHDHDGSLPATTTWHALEPVRIAVLDARFERYALRWPALHAVLQRRTAEQAAHTALHAAILSLATVEQRLIGLLWHLADRRGHVQGDGVTVRLDVTHAQLGALAGARRSTATLALKRLASEGLLTRLDDGRWLLSHASKESFDAVD